MSLSIDEAELKIEEAIEHFSENLKKLRTGRANVSMLDNIVVEVYGAPTPLKHIATLNAVDAQLIQVQPFDPSNLEAISNTIREDQSLGLNPADDGKVIRLPIPPMTSERRQEVVKALHEKVEQANISLRNVRQDLLKTLKAQKNDGDIGEDEEKRLEKQFQDIMDSAKARIEEISKVKEKEILTV